MSGNIWELACKGRVEECMRLLGCEERYVSGAASDFEKFREWCAVLEHLKGNRTAADFYVFLKDSVGVELSENGINGKNAEALWRSCNQKLGYFFDDEICDEKENRSNYVSSCKINAEKDKYKGNMTDVAKVVTALGESSVDKLTNLLISQGNNGYFFDFGEGEFRRPDRYRAGLILEKICCGEKYEIEEMNFLLSQLVCEILYVEKYNETFFVFEHSKGRACSQGTVEYLRSRSLGGRIFLQASLTDTCPEQLKSTCAASTDKLFISPVLLCGKGEDQEALRSKIAETYPLGAVRWRSC